MEEDVIIPMNKEIKDKWVEALRSGDYVQGKHVLRTEDNTFCCLGVLYDIVSGDWQDKLVSYDIFDNETKTNTTLRIYQTPDYSKTMFCIDTAKLCGLDYNEQEYLAGRNDEGESFESIADWIEKNL